MLEELILSVVAFQVNNFHDLNLNYYLRDYFFGLLCLVHYLINYFSFVCLSYCLCLGSTHIPYAEFEAKLESIVANSITAWRESHAPSENSRIVFFCMYGAQRGPACALRTMEEIDIQLNQTDVTENNSLRSGPKVYVLRGGFTSWLNTHFSSNPELIENYQEDKWLDTKTNEGLVYKSDVPDHVTAATKTTEAPVSIAE